MSQRLKSWESPRNEGRNSKGKGGSARARQLKKQQQTLRKQLKAQLKAQIKAQNNQQNNQGKGTDVSFLYFLSRPEKFLKQVSIRQIPDVLKSHSNHR
jgi:hypothetical protein